MEETQLTPTPESSDTKGCVNCGSHAVVEGYPTPLCNECRERFIKYPVPLGIKIFGAAVLLVMVFSLVTFPKHLSLGMHLERGKQLEQKHQYKAAQQEFAEVVKKVPNNVEAKGHLMIAAFYNMDFKTFSEKGQELKGVNFEDGELLNRLNTLVDKMEGFFPDDSTMSWMNKYDVINHDIPDSAYHTFLARYPRNLFVMLTYATREYDKKNYAVCDSLLQEILKVDTEHVLALRMLANSQKEQGKYEEAIKNCDRILQINKDEVYAYAIQARTYLKQNKDALALELAAKSVALDKKDAYNKATLALAYHFNNMQEKRDALIREAKASKDTSVMHYMQYTIDVIEQKEKFRN